MRSALELQARGRRRETLGLELEHGRWGALPNSVDCNHSDAVRLAKREISDRVLAAVAGGRSVPCAIHVDARGGTRGEEQEEKGEWIEIEQLRSAFASPLSPSISPLTISLSLTCTR